MIEQCPQLLAKIQENNCGPTPNIQLISVKQRPAATLNLVTRSGATTHIQNTPTQPVAVCTRKASEKVPALDTARDEEPVKEA